MLATSTHCVPKTVRTPRKLLEMGRQGGPRLAFLADVGAPVVHVRYLEALPLWCHMVRSSAHLEDSIRKACFATRRCFPSGNLESFLPTRSLRFPTRCGDGGLLESLGRPLILPQEKTLKFTHSPENLVATRVLWVDRFSTFKAFSHSNANCITSFSTHFLCAHVIDTAGRPTAQHRCLRNIARTRRNGH